MSTFDDTFTESVQALQAWLDYLNNLEQELRDKMSRMQQAAAQSPAAGEAGPADAFQGAAVPPDTRPVQDAVPAQPAPPSESDAAPAIADDDDPWL